MGRNCFIKLMKEETLVVSQWKQTLWVVEGQKISGTGGFSKCGMDN